MGPISWLSYSIPKAGNTDGENEDAVYPVAGIGQNGNNEVATFIVADGATQTSFSGLWAKCLISSCSQTRLSEFNLLRAVNKAQLEWDQSLIGTELPWHAQEKFRLGAFSALAWLEIQYFPLHPAYAFTWRALAVGDCCLFIARNQSIYLSLPLQEVGDFQKKPLLIPSKSEKMDSIKGKVQSARGSLMMGDKLILASDAISSWIMRKPQTDRLEFLALIKSIKNARNGSGFSHWIDNLRKSGDLKNDDTSIILIELGQGGV